MRARRRGLHRAQSLLREASRNVRRVSSDFSGRGHGLLPRLRNLLRYRPADDEILRERVRSKAGHFLTHGRALRVGIRDGVVTLAGGVPFAESKRLAFHVRLLPGVKKVRNRVRHHRARADSEAGRPKRWPPAVRFSAIVLGAAFLLLGLAPGGRRGIPLSAAGVWLGLRGLYNRPLP